MKKNTNIIVYNSELQFIYIMFKSFVFTLKNTYWVTLMINNE